MTKNKSTKRALISSALAILLCLAMLIGTTFAWFTDTASTAVNKIQAGNLKIALSYKNNTTNGEFASADETTKVFDENALWEPGHVEYAVLNVANKGNLALKYKLGINIVSETGSTNVNGNEFKLSDYIRFGVVDNDQSALDRDALVAAAGAGTVLNAGYSDEKHLPTSENKTVTLVVWMPTTVGNEANHATDAAAPTINLGLNVVATQDTVEYDSFGNTYDETAEYPIADVNELSKNIQAGGKVLFGTDVKTPNGFTMTNNADLSLNGQTWTVGDNTNLRDANLTVSGGTVLGETFSAYIQVRPSTTNNGVVTYTNVNFVNTYKAGQTTGGGFTSHADHVIMYVPESAGNHTKFVFKNCTFTNSVVDFSGLSGKTGSIEAIFENCTFKALTRDSLIEVSYYLTDDSTITIKDCTFDVTATDNFYIINGYYGGTGTVNFEGSNTFKGVKATPTEADKTGTPDEIKVSTKDLSVKVCRAKTINGLETVTVSGVVTK